MNEEEYIEFLEQIPLETTIKVSNEMAFINLIVELGYREYKMWTPDEDELLNKLCQLAKKHTDSILEDIEKACNKVWEFWYCPCVHESAAATMSLHRTKKGAELAMEFHKEEARIKFEERSKRWKEEGNDWGFKFGQNEDWGVREIEILD